MKTTVAAQRNIFREFVRRFADQHEDNTDFREILVDARIALAQFTDTGEDVARLEHYDTKPYADPIVREVRDYRCSRCHHHASDHDSFCRECGARFVRSANPNPGGNMNPTPSPDGPASAPASAPEPLSAILADYRADIPAMTSGELPHPTPEFLRILLDRIEAAAERERRNYQRLHECFWSQGAVQSVVRQMLDAASDLQGAEPKEAEDLKHYAGELIDCGQAAPGNAAALREALIYVRDLMRSVKDGDRVSSFAFLGVVELALAEPARNCDRFATADDAANAYRSETEPDRQNSDCYWPCIFEWLFAPAEGGRE